MEQRFGLLGLVSERVSAVQPDQISQADIDRFCDPRRYRWLTPPELACGLSHLAALRVFLQAGAPFGAIFEDDAVLSEVLPAFLSAIESNAPELDLIRLETFNERLLVDPSGSRQLGPVATRTIYSQSNGSAGYVVSRRGAIAIVESVEIKATQADFALFNPHHSLARQLRVQHVDPGLCIQQHRLGSSELSSIDSQIVGAREQRRILARKHRLIRDARRLREFLELVVRIKPRELWARRTKKAVWRSIPFMDQRHDSSIERAAD